MEVKKLNINNFSVRKFYESSILKMRKQYGDVLQLRELHINSEGKVFSGEWIDSRGISNFCGGFAIDCVKVIKFW